MRRKTEFDDLLDMTVTAVHIGADDDDLDHKDGHSRACLKFTTANGYEYAYAATGDCCSLSWFNHLSGLDLLVGQKVREIQEKPVAEVIESSDDYIQVYGWTFVTALGHVDLEMRNASNGYYGGDVEKMNDGSDKIAWKPIEADF